MPCSAPACVGLDLDAPAEFAGFVSRVGPRSQVVRSSGNRAVLRWQDASGARLLLAVADGHLVDLMPSFAGRPGVRLDGVTASPSVTVASAAGLWPGAPQTTTLAAELEEHWFLPGGSGQHVRGPAALVALGVDVQVLAKAPSPADSLFGPESFFPFGLFDADRSRGGPAPFAELTGTVLAAERRTVELTGRSFSVARVRTCGFEADLCLPVDGRAPPPVPGNVVTGVVYLVGSVPAKVSRWRRRQR